jgi:hypothetical protein
VKGCGQCGQPKSVPAHTAHSPYDDEGWSPFRSSSGPLFDCQGSDWVPEMVPFSINKWLPFQLTKTKEYSL